MKKWAFILCLGLAACNAEKRTQRYLFEHPEFTAGVCAEQFPVIAVSDSSEYKKSKRVIDSLYNELLVNDILSDGERSRLMLEIERIKSSMLHPKSCDSLTNAIYILVSKEKARGDKLQSAYNNLLAASRGLKPVHDTIQNRAREHELELQLSKANGVIAELVAKNTKLEEDRDTWKGKAKTRWWWIALLIGGAAALAIFKVVKAVKPSV